MLFSTQFFKLFCYCGTLDEISSKVTPHARIVMHNGRNRVEGISTQMYSWFFTVFASILYKTAASGLIYMLTIGNHNQPLSGVMTSHSWIALKLFNGVQRTVFRKRLYPYLALYSQTIRNLFYTASILWHWQFKGKSGDKIRILSWYKILFDTFHWTYFMQMLFFRDVQIDVE